MTHEVTPDERSTPSNENSDRCLDDWRSFESPTAAVVEAVADATDRKALELPPLHRSIDTDALNTIVTESDHKNSLEVSFSYCGLAVVLDSNGTLELSELD